MPSPKDKLAEMVPIEREGSVDEDLLEDSSRRIEEHLRQQGYYKARVTHERLEDSGTLTIVFHIHQDRLFRVAPGGVEISGNQAIPIEEFRPFIKISAGEPFVSAKLDALTAAIKQVYQRRGFANVAVASGVNEVGEAVLKPTIVIKEGSSVLVGAATFEGNRKLTTEDLLRLIESRAEQPFYAPTVAADREKIRVAYLNLGFASAQVNSDAGAVLGRRARRPPLQGRGRAADGHRSHPDRGQHAHRSRRHPARAAVPRGTAARSGGVDREPAAVVGARLVPARAHRAAGAWIAE